MNKEEFKSLVESTIDAKYAEIIEKKSSTEKYLTYVDAKTMTTVVRNIFKHKIKVTPKEIEAACELSEALLSPSAKERINHIKAVLSIAGGAAGIAMIITGIGSALGWGAGVITAVIAFFMGTPPAGPVGWIAGGVAIVAIAGYFAFSGNPQKDTERFLKALKGAINGAIDKIWDEYKEFLSKE